MNLKRTPKKPSHNSHLFRCLSFLLSLLAAILTLCPASITKAASQTDVSSQQSFAKNEKSVKITICAAGDCTLGSDSRYNSIFNSYYDKNGPAYFLKNVKKAFSKDDVTIVNLEGTFTDSDSRAIKTFTFKGPAAYADILKRGSVEVVNTANNHTFDFGRQGYLDTLKTLKDNKIKHCRNSTIAYKQVNGVKIAFLGFDMLAGVTENTVKDTIRKAKKNNSDIIIVSFHWGIERSYYPVPAQETIARTAIDSGASLVLGHHPHVLQGIELYKGRYIVYSLGNFCFGGNSNPSDKDTMIFRQTFTVKDHTVKKNAAARVIPCSLSSKSYTNDFQPVILSGQEKARVLDRLRTFSAGRGVSFRSDGKIQR